MEYIKVLATDSTNTELKRRYRLDNRLANTCLSAGFQTQGKGQRGSGWQAEPGKNLITSIFLSQITLKKEELFKLNILISLNLQSQLSEIKGLPKISIKWPNDILAGTKKLGGILIEPIWKNNKIRHVVIGIGLNVNQTDFPTLPRASSLKLLTHTDFHLDELLHKLVENLERSLYNQLETPLEALIPTYENRLFKIHEPAPFRLPKGEVKTGIIRGISQQGKLKIEFDQTLQLFDIKEIKMQY